MNFRGILSKSSLRSSSSSGKSLPHSEEITKLYTEIELLKKTVESLKISLESRDAAIGTLARDKEKLYVELKSAQRTNRNVHQQLVDERDIHSKEKEFLIEEIERITKNEDNERLNSCVDVEELNRSLKEEIKAKNEVICNICTKYLKIKSSKTNLQQHLEKIQLQSEKTCEDIILLLEENRQTLDNLLCKIIRTTISPNSKKFLKLLKINANLHYENTQLKVCLSKKDLHKEITQEDKEFNDEVNTTHKKFSKSENSLKQIRYHLRSPHFKSFMMSNDNIISRNFMKFHFNCTPYFRRRSNRISNSDPCLSRF